MTATPPKKRPAAAGVSLLTALLLVGVGVVAVRDLAVTQGWSSGTAWSLSLAEALDGLTASVWVLVAGIAVGLVGLLLVWLALKPSAATHRRSAASDQLWLSTPAIAALAQGVADRAPGVISAEAGRVSRRRITLEVVTSQDPQAVTQRVDDALTSVRGLTTTTISVRTREVPR